MTVLVGILCTDGVVVGSDSSATFSSPQIPTIEQFTTKVHVIGTNIIVAGTGQVGLGQRFCHMMSQIKDSSTWRTGSAIDRAKQVSASAIQDFASTQASKGQYGALLAFHCHNSYHLVEFALTDFQPEMKTVDCCFVSMGSGQMITDPFLAFLKRVFFPGGPPTLRQGVQLAVWALSNAIELNTGGIKGPMQVATLTGSTPQAVKIENDALGEHEQFAKEAEKFLATYPTTVSSTQGGTIPTL